MTRLILLFALLTGCAAHSQPPKPSYLCWSRNLSYCEPMWRMEASQRFANPVLLICHGMTHTGAWRLDTDPPNRIVSVESTVQVLCSLYPDRPIVVIACNEGGLKLYAPRANVWYARKLVSAWPVMFNPTIKLSHPEWVSSIWDFVEAEHAQ